MLWNLVEPGSDLWTDALGELRHDFYHLPQYVRVCVSLYEGGRPRAFIARDADGVFLLPLILRPIEVDGVETSLSDAIGPYGYASPIMSVRPGCDENQFLERAIDALLKCLMANQVVSVFARLHPMLALPHEPLQRRGTVVEHGPTVYCDLRRSSTELWHATREAVRRQIRRVEKEGYIAEEDPTWTHYEAFQEVYGDTMRRVGASEWYFFDRDHFAQLKEALAGTMHLLVVRSGSQIVCAGLFSQLCGIAQYHLAGTRDGYEKCDVSKLLIHYARGWAKERGNEVLHLGGGVGAAHDSLLHFKTGFSKLQSTFHTWRLIVDPQAYRDLVVRSRAQSASDNDEPSGYFPEYRVDRPRSVQSAVPQEATAIKE
jgi:hypothetical protein